MSNKNGKSAARFSPLHKSEALRVVSEHFGIINDNTLRDVEKRIGRSLTRQCLSGWVRAANGFTRKRASHPSVNDPVAEQKVETIVNDGNTLATAQQVQRAIEQAQQVDERTTDEKLSDLLDVLISIPAEQVNRMPPEKRLRLFEPLSAAWQRRKDIPGPVFDALPELRELIELLAGSPLAPSLRAALDVAIKATKSALSDIQAAHADEDQQLDSEIVAAFGALTELLEARADTTLVPLKDAITALNTEVRDGIARYQAERAAAFGSSLPLIDVTPDVAIPALGLGSGRDEYSSDNTVYRTNGSGTGDRGGVEADDHGRGPLR
jgi:hypothetical protein